MDSSTFGLDKPSNILIYSIQWIERDFKTDLADSLLLELIKLKERWNALPGG